MYFLEATFCSALRSVKIDGSNSAFIVQGFTLPLVGKLGEGDDAKGALDRITIPQDVLDHIAPTALPRSSLIISDEPLSAETNYRTEFVAVLSNHPQGGFVTRSPTAIDRIMADDGFSSFRRAGSQSGSSYWDYQTSPQRWRSQPGNWQRGW